MEDTMVRLASVSTCLLSMVFYASGQSVSLGSHFGVGVGVYSYTTSWYYYNPSGSVGSREHYPVHVLNRTQMLGYYEIPNLISLGSMGVGLRGELHVGIAGGTKEDWLPLGETISSGGSTFGGDIGVKVSYAFAALPAISLAPYVFPSFHYANLSSNGEGVGTAFANRAEYQYSSGWEETVFGLSLGIGVNIGITSVVISPEYRFFVAGGAGTDWTPAGREPMNEGPTFGAFVISVGIKL